MDVYKKWTNVKRVWCVCGRYSVLGRVRGDSCDGVGGLRLTGTGIAVELDFEYTFCGVIVDAE